MSETAQIINIFVLAITIWWGMKSLSKRTKANSKEETEKQWSRGAVIASHDKEYMEFVNDITPSGKEDDPNKWHFKMPDSALKHLEACFEEDERKIYLMKRAIELSIEHFAIEMEDDAQCIRIIAERVFNNPKKTEPFERDEH
jgi:hypothetical protein